jgi:membrane-associated phospholipid phosphatase
MRSQPFGALLGVVALTCAAASAAEAKGDVRASDDTTKTFFVGRDLAYLGVAAAGTALTSVYDVHIAHWALQPSVQGGSSRQHLMRTLTDWSGETTLTWASGVGYVAGRVSHSSTLADVSLHMIEAQALTSVFGQAVRGVLGRQRPSVNPDTAWRLHWGQGFTHYDYRAFPSLHSAAGFVAASAITSEMEVRHSAATPYVAPILYGVAMIPGLTRVYNGQHWGSDVVAGAFLGTFFGNRVVHYAHTHARTRLDRALLGASVAQGADGSPMLVVTIPE